MFGIAWSELLLIGIVALVVVPPKDLPTMMRTVGKWVSQMRRMAFDFQSQVSTALREAEFDDIKQSVADLTSLDAMGDIKKELESVTNPVSQLEGQMRTDLTIAPPSTSIAQTHSIEAPASLAAGDGPAARPPPEPASAESAPNIEPEPEFAGHPALPVSTEALPVLVPEPHRLPELVEAAHPGNDAGETTPHHSAPSVAASGVSQA